LGREDIEPIIDGAIINKRIVRELNKLALMLVPILSERRDFISDNRDMGRIALRIETQIGRTKGPIIVGEALVNLKDKLLA